MASSRLTAVGQQLLDDAARAASQKSWQEMADLAQAAIVLVPDDHDAVALLKAAKTMIAATPATAADEQTGQLYVLRREDPKATLAATCSGVYLLLALGFFIWMLFDTWTNRDLLITQLGYQKTAVTLGSYRLMAFTGLAGGLGGILNGIRSLISWHAERDAYGPRFLWKDLACPFIGGTVGVFAYVALRSGVGVISGNFSLSDPNGIAALSAFAIAAVAGFSWHQVFKWLDSQANRIFSIPAPATGAGTSSGSLSPTAAADPRTQPGPLDPTAAGQALAVSTAGQVAETAASPEQAAT